MPLVTPSVRWNGYESNVSAPADSFGTVVTADTTIHTKNATYTQLIASTSFDTYRIQVIGNNVAQATVATSILCDIAIGAAASETVIIPNLNFGGANPASAGAGVASPGQTYEFPLYIPAGSRLSATAQSLISADTVAVTVKLFGRPSMPVWAGSLVTDYGTTLATSLGTSVAIGTVGAEGSYTQITASTTQPASYLAFGVGPAADTSIQGGAAFADVGVGAATESAVITDGMYATGSNEVFSIPIPIGAFVDIPTGSRLAVRLSKASSGAENHDVILYGVS